MRKVLLVLLCLCLILPAFTAHGADMQEEGAIKDVLKAYFDLRYQSLSTLTAAADMKSFIAPSILNSKAAVNEADVVDTIVGLRKLHINDLRFSKYTFQLDYLSLQVRENKAFVAVEEKYELFFNCAPTVPNQGSVPHNIVLEKDGGRWFIVSDEYNDADGVKKALSSAFINNAISLEEARDMVLKKGEEEFAGRAAGLKEILDKGDIANPILFFTGKTAAYTPAGMEKIDPAGTVSPIMVNGRILLPLRFIGKKLGAGVSWNGETMTAVITKAGQRLEVSPGVKAMRIDGKEVPLDVPAQIISDRIMMPVRAISEAFGKWVFWDDRGLVVLSDNPIDPAGHKEQVESLVRYFNVFFTKTDFPRIDGSTATYPFSIEMGKALLGLDEIGAKGFLTHNTTHTAYENLIQGKADIIFVTEPSADEYALAEKSGVELEVIPFCKEGFVFLVNGNNPVEGLSVKEIQDIYQGKIKNWKEVGGEDSRIIPYQREANSGSQTLMENTVMKGLRLAAAPREEIIQGMGGLIDRVADYSNAKNALGYSVYYYATQMYAGRDIKLLAIDGVKPDNGTIGNETYPFTVGYYAVLRKDAAPDSNERRLLEWVLSGEGQSVVNKAGFVEINQAEGRE